MSERTLKKSNPLQKFMSFEQSGLILALVALCIVFGFLTGDGSGGSIFLSLNNWMNILRQVSLNIIAAIGMTMIILSGEIDLSVGSLQALAGVLSVMVMNALTASGVDPSLSVFVALLTALGIGVGAGLVNGLLVTKAGINSLIATLATMAIFRGTIMVITNAVSQTVSVDWFQNIATGNLLGIPLPSIIAAALIVVFYFILNNTVFGRYIYAVGGNSDSAKLAGLNVGSIKLKVYVVGNVLFSLSAFILISRLNSGQPIAGTGMEMQVIAAVILGGVSLTGGTGSLIGAIIGVIMLGVIQNGLVLMNVNSFWQDIVRGLVILIAVYLDVRRKKSMEIRLLRESQAAMM